MAAGAVELAKGRVALPEAEAETGRTAEDSRAEAAAVVAGAVPFLPTAGVAAGAAEVLPLPFPLGWAAAAEVAAAAADVTLSFILLATLLETWLASVTGQTTVVEMTESVTMTVETAPGGRAEMAAVWLALAGQLGTVGAHEMMVRTAVSLTVRVVNWTPALPEAAAELAAAELAGSLVGDAPLRPSPAAMLVGAVAFWRLKLWKSRCGCLG